MKTPFIRYALLGALAVGLTLPMASAARADHDYRQECHDRLQAQKDKIDHDASRYGDHSAKVAHDVDKLEQERQWCRDHKAEWDHSLFDVGIYVHH
jgi:uncharacterized membrane-anchored protein YhcB (DUF1043 family)